MKKISNPKGAGRKPIMDFKLIRYYDTCCDLCGNWASGDVGAAALAKNKDMAEKVLKFEGWIVKEGKVICGFCANNKARW